jgi:hypothetical protein
MTDPHLKEILLRLENHRLAIKKQKQERYFAPSNALIALQLATLNWVEQMVRDVFKEAE